MIFISGHLPRGHLAIYGGGLSTHPPLLIREAPKTIFVVLKTMHTTYGFEGIYVWFTTVSNFTISLLDIC